MAKIGNICPINHKPCIDCTIYRGRHQSCGKAPATIDDEKIMNEIEMIVNPTFSMDGTIDNINVELTYVNVEDVTSQKIDYKELESLDWDNPFFIRRVDGIHITSYDKFVRVLKFKELQGKGQISLVETPHFMLGGTI